LTDGWAERSGVSLLMEKPSAFSGAGVSSRFATTHWSLVLAAGDRDAPEWAEYRELLREEIGRVVGEPADTDQEIRQLFVAVRYGS
jgi:hypothetical protein